MISENAFASLAEVVLSELTNTPVTHPREFFAEAESNGTVIRLLYGPQTGEWSLVLLQPDQVDPPFELPDLLRVTPCPEQTWRVFRGVITQDGAVAQRILLDGAAALKRYGQAYLAADGDAFSAARRVRSERAADFTASVNQAGAIRQATEAWAAGDLNRVVETLAPFRGSLPSDQERRLSYAERKSSDVGT